MLPIKVITFGIQGLAGPGILSGDGAPPSDLGTNGSFYIDAVALDLYGPKAADDWGAPTSMIASLTPTNLLAVIGAMDAAQLASLRSLLGIPTYNNLAAANAALVIGDTFFDLARSRVTSATN